MPLHAQTMSNNLEDTDVSRVDASDLSEARAAGYIAALEVESSPETIAIELNFNAFADNVPPTQHAKRVASNSDPSVQDFADQALELAALRAELKRLTRDYDAVRHTLRLRDMRLQTMQEELSAARTQLRSMTRQPTEGQSQPAAITGESAPENRRPAEQVGTSPVRETPPPVEAPVAHELSSTLLLPALQAQAPAVAPETTSATREVQVLPLAPRRQLVPLNHDGEAVTLSRDIITIGRTRENDICIASRAVSRDHARLLMNPRSVTIVDMNSANGCFVNDQPVKKQKLRDGDVLRIGDRSYRFTHDFDPAQQGRDLQS
jgi:FHA domain